MAGDALSATNESKRLEIRVEPETHQDPIFPSHPLAEISDSPGHLLLLRLWQRDESLSGCRVSAVESRSDDLKRELFHLGFLFFAFHFLFLTLLFVSSASASRTRGCERWPLSFSLSLVTSVVLISSVQWKVWRFWKAREALQREKGEGRALRRWVQELRMKGASFDLGKDAAAAAAKEGKTETKKKSSSVEAKWRLLQWCKRNVVTLWLVGFAGVAMAASRFIVCG